jgi:hypothetical protein
VYPRESVCIPNLHVEKSIGACRRVGLYTKTPRGENGVSSRVHPGVFVYIFSSWRTLLTL